MISAEQVFEIVQQKGLVIPSDINSELKTDTFIVGAMLSELVQAKRVRISHAKIGGTPVYYIPNQKEKLERLYQYLNQKDKRTYDSLKEKGVLADQQQDPLTKTGLRVLKDFAIPIKVNYKGQESLFWKWHLLPDEEAKAKMREVLKILYPEPKKETKTEKPKEEVIETKVEVKSPNLKQDKEIQEKLNDNKDIDDEFFYEVKNYLAKHEVSVASAQVIRKGAELDLIVHIPSQIGVLEHFCKAKNKKKSNEGDLASAFLDGQIKRLPTIYLSKGDIPKKVEAILSTKFKGLKVLKM